MPQFITIGEVAEMLHVSGDTVRRMVERGDLMGYRIGSRLRFNLEDIETYIENAKTKKHGG